MTQLLAGHHGFRINDGLQVFLPDLTRVGVSTETEPEEPKGGGVCVYNISSGMDIFTSYLGWGFFLPQVGLFLLRVGFFSK